jgi:hypothetical protein
VRLLLLLLLLLVRHAHAYNHAWSRDTHAWSRVLLVLVGHAGAGLLRGRVVVVHAKGRGHTVVLLVVGRNVRGNVLGVLGHLVVEPRRTVLRLRLGVERRQGVGSRANGLRAIDIQVVNPRVGARKVENSHLSVNISVAAL